MGWNSGGRVVMKVIDDGGVCPERNITSVLLMELNSQRRDCGEGATTFYAAPCACTCDHCHCSDNTVREVQDLSRISRGP